VSNKLSPRETEVLKVYMQHGSQAKAGLLMHISAKTVHTYLRNAMRKLGARHLVDLVRVCIRERIIEE